MEYSRKGKGANMKRIFIFVLASAFMVGSAFAAGTTTTVAKTPVTTVATVGTPAVDLTVTGTIQKIVNANKTKNTTEQIVVLVDGKQTTFIVLGTTQVTNADGKSIKFSALAKGKKVTIAYKTTAKGNEATSVAITK
jgi:hypothetical protein